MKLREADDAGGALVAVSTLSVVCRRLSQDLSPTRLPTVNRPRASDLIFELASTSSVKREENPLRVRMLQ